MSTPLIILLVVFIATTLIYVISMTTVYRRHPEYKELAGNEIDWSRTNICFAALMIALVGHIVIIAVYSTELAALASPVLIVLSTVLSIEQSKMMRTAMNNRRVLLAGQ